MQIQSNNPFRDPSLFTAAPADTLPPAYTRYDQPSPVPRPVATCAQRYEDSDLGHHHGTDVGYSQGHANAYGNGPSNGHGNEHCGQDGKEHDNGWNANPNHRPSPNPLPSAQSSFNTASQNPYGSPFASNPSWSPSPSDHTLFSIPSRSFQDKIKNRFARTPGDIFNPPCPSFSRPLPRTISQPFESIIIKGDGANLADSFKPEYPGRILAPRDVSLADFARFLEDIAVAGRLEGHQQLIAVAAPITAHMGLAGHFVTKAIQKRMSRAKEPLCIEAIEVWCEAFFVPRGLDVFTVSQSEGRLTARRPRGEVLPLGRELGDLTRRINREGSRSRSVSSSSEDEQEGGAGHNEQLQGQENGYQVAYEQRMGYEGPGRRGMGRGRGRGRGMARMGGGELIGRREIREARRAEKDERKEQRQAKKDERKEERRAKKDDRKAEKEEKKAKRHDKFYLVISPLRL